MAERYGWINRAVPIAELDAFVATLAANTAALPDGVVAAAKRAVPHADAGDGFTRESDGWMGLVFKPATGQLMAEQLKAGAQTRDGERSDAFRGRQADRSPRRRPDSRCSDPQSRSGRVQGRPIRSAAAWRATLATARAGGAVGRRAGCDRTGTGLSAADHAPRRVLHDRPAAHGRGLPLSQRLGALSVAQLMVSPLAADLFGGAIAQSVYMPAMPELRTERFGLPAAETVGVEFGRQVGVADVAALRAVSAEALLAAPDNPFHMIGGTTAIVDGWALPAQIFETFDRGGQAQVPFIAGYTSGEQRGLDPGTLPPFPSDPDAFRTSVSAAYGELAPAFLQLYPPDMVVDSSYAAVRDAYYGWAVERLLRAHARWTGAAWMYYFDHVYASAAARVLGAFHASDIAFTFGNIGPDALTPANWPASP